MARKLINIPAYLMEKINEKTLETLRPDLKGLDENTKVRILLQEKVSDILKNSTAILNKSMGPDFSPVRVPLTAST